LHENARYPAGGGVPSLPAFFGSLAITRQTQVIGFAQ
jgi:hypothetical protein